MNKVILMILDGYGNGNHSKSDAIFNAHADYIEQLKKSYPTSELLTCGENVGLPDGQMGNSEVGHLNLGAGRVVYQDLVKINKAAADGSMAKNPVIAEAFSYAKANNKAVHFIGLMSDGGVHSLDKHIYKLCDIAEDFGLERVFVHAFMDGRDTDPKSGRGYLEGLLSHINGTHCRLASVIGRYYAMDRDKRWDRVKLAYDLMVNGQGDKVSDPLKAIATSYSEGVTDEFIKPMVCVGADNLPLATILEGDVVFSINYRSDRGREITQVLAEQNMPDHGMHVIPNVHYLTMTPYDEQFKNVRIVYGKDNIENTLGETISKAGVEQLHIAETEKYAHVTFFFNGGREEPFSGEKRILINSPKVATYDLQPEMSALAVKDALVEEISKEQMGFICVNFANGDMVGHTGVYDAIVKAIKTVDSCVSAVVAAASTHGYTVLITADHGNADYAVNDDGTPNTAHSLNPVPFIVVSNSITSVANGVLADVAPTVLKIMGIAQPTDMTGTPLV